MNATSLREQLNLQIGELPDDLVEEIADFTAFVLARRQMAAQYLDWSADQWKTLSLGQFLRDLGDDVAYTVDDADVVYNR